MNIRHFIYSQPSWFTYKHSLCLFLYKVSGGWSAWGKWSECVRFGEDDFDVRVRVRSCDNPAPMNGGNCEGSVFETEACLPDEEVVENENVGG